MREERGTCGVSSDIRLMNLLRKRLIEIMDRERANRNSIHLYCTGPYWIAFERSVYQLYRAFPDSEIIPLCLLVHPFLIVMVSVTDHSLHSYTRKHILRRDGLNYKLLTVSGFLLTDYREQHAGEVEGLPRLNENQIRAEKRRSDPPDDDGCLQRLGGPLVLVDRLAPLQHTPLRPSGGPALL